MDSPTADLGIVVRDVWRHFGAVPALSGMSLSAPYGQVTALVGPNGAGKTTLLLVLASLLRPDRGEVRVAGLDPEHDPAGVRSPDGLDARHVRPLRAADRRGSTCGSSPTRTGWAAPVRTTAWPNCSRSST